jgi:hypothetical protein
LSRHTTASVSPLFYEIQTVFYCYYF